MWLGSGTFPLGGRQLKLTQHSSPNFGQRRNGATPNLVVIHYTATSTAEDALATLTEPKSEVSAHYLIAEDGEVFALVAEENRAWHAGAGQWGQVTDVNSYSIGIELSNTGFTPFAAPQMAALENLLCDILNRWSIGPERVIGHSDMAPGRKIDPGTRFDWRRLALQNLSIWPEATDKTPDFRASMQRFGYTAPKGDDLLLDTFRRRFRPHASGPLDDTDRALIADLADRYPVDAQATCV